MAVGAGSRNNDPAGPRKDSSGLNASSASRPSSGGYNSATRGGNISSNGLGLATGATMFGNTAFGPAGGRAVGYATNSRLPSGVGPSMGVFSNFRTPSGAPMVGGALQNRAVTARNPQQALGMLQALAGAQRPSTPRVGGLLADEGVTVGEIPEPTSIVPTAAEDLSWIPESLNFSWPGQAVNPAVRSLSNAFWPGQSTMVKYRAPTMVTPTSGYLTGQLGRSRVPYTVSDPPYKNYPAPGGVPDVGPGSIHHKTSGYGSLRGR